MFPSVEQSNAAVLHSQNAFSWLCRWVLPEKEDVLEEQASYREKQLSFVRGKSARPADYSEEQRELELLEGSIPTNQPMVQAALTQAPNGSDSGREAGATLRHRFSARVEVTEGLEASENENTRESLEEGGAANGLALQHLPSQVRAYLMPWGAAYGRVLPRAACGSQPASCRRPWEHGPLPLGG